MNYFWKHFYLYYILYSIYLEISLSGGTKVDAGLLARSQYSEGPATGHLDTGFSSFPFV